MASPSGSVGTGLPALGEGERILLPDDALVVTHASRHYHTAPGTIAATEAWVSAAMRQGRVTVALAQEPLATDPDWYAPRAGFTREFPSHAGEHPLYPDGSGDALFRVTALGGYHSACLGWTMAEVAARFLRDGPATTLRLTLPMAAIFTGYRFGPGGGLIPATPEDEAKADDSVDGLSLADATRAMPDAEWTAFMRESLRWAFFERAPVWNADLRGVTFRLLRDGRLLATFRKSNGVPVGSRGKTVEFHYVSGTP